MGSASASSCVMFFRAFARRPECMPFLPPPGMSAPRTRSACRRQFKLPVRSGKSSENFPVRRGEQYPICYANIRNSNVLETYSETKEAAILGDISHISIQIVMITYLLGHDPRILGRKKLKKVSWLRQLTSYKICRYLRVGRRGDLLYNGYITVHLYSH